MSNLNDFVIENGVLVKYLGNDETIIVPEVEKVSVSAFGRRLYSGTLNVKSIVFNSGLKSIDGASAESHASSIRSFDRCVKLEHVIFPEGLEELGISAFNSCRTLKEVYIPESVKKIGYHAFYKCESLAYIVAPGIPVTEIEDKAMAALGYCMEPERFSGEVKESYEYYLQRNASTVLKRAQKYGCVGAMTYLENRKAKTVKKKKVSAKQAVLDVEHAIIDKDFNKLKTLIEEYSPLEFTARALGLACRLCPADTVKLLLESGFTFKLDMTMAKQFPISYLPSERIYIANYAMMPVVQDIWNQYLFGDMKKNFTNDMNFTMQNEEERIKNIELLYHAKELQGEDLNLALYYAIIEGQFSIVEALVNLGAVMDVPWITSTDRSVVSERYRFIQSLSNLDSEKQYKALGLLNKYTQGKIYVSNAMFEDSFVTRKLEINAQNLDFLLEISETESLNKSKIIQAEIETGGDINKVAVYLKHNFVTSPKVREKLIKCAQDQSNTELLALLLEYKNKTADLVKEQATEEKKAMHELTKSLALDSVETLKKIWGYKKKEDGTLVITSYKGTEKAVIIPEKIGKATVTEIGEKSFSQYALRISSEMKKVRREIISVFVPGSITRIGTKAFAGCANLNNVTLSAGLIQVGEDAFYNCINLSKIDIPNSVTMIGDNAFCDCKSLSKVNLPDSIIAIGSGAFSSTYSLEEIVLPKKIEQIEACTFMGCRNLSSIILPENLKSIQAYAFNGCRKLLNEKGMLILNHMFVEYCGTDGHIDVPEDIVSICSGAFQGCKNLSSITIPESVTSIGDEAFRYCENLSNIVISGSVTKIGEDAFKFCKKLTIHAPARSRAAKYAKENNIPLVVEG